MRLHSMIKWQALQSAMASRQQGCKTTAPKLMPDKLHPAICYPAICPGRRREAPQTPGMGLGPQKCAMAVPRDAVAIRPTTPECLWSHNDDAIGDIGQSPLL